MKLFTKIQLSTMMFFQFFIWGGWWVTLGTFLSKNLNATGIEISTAFSTQSWGAIIAPLFIGLIADKFFNAERILGFLHILGGLFLYLMTYASDFQSFYPYILVYMIIYMPTLALVNSVAFYQMKDTAKDFSSIRVFGSIGWIIAGLMISYLFKWDSNESIENGKLINTIKMVSIVSFILGLFSFTLPKTPPSKNEKNKFSLKEIFGLDALKLLNDKNFFLFFISSILICIPLAFYYQNTNPFLVDLSVTNPTGKMTLGQISEVLFMLLLPIFYKRFGFKKTILIGIFAWTIRYVLFSLGAINGENFLLISGIILHGICYDFFFVSGQIYTDHKADKKIKSAAQGLITLATYGLGMLIGYWIAGRILSIYTLQNGEFDWFYIWIIPGIFSFFVFLFFLTIFKEKNETKYQINNS